MKDLSENEKRLLEELEASAARLHTLCAMLELFEESDSFSFDSEHLNPQARIAHRHRVVRMLGGLQALTQHYYQETAQVVNGVYSAS